jgi:hypothetical protein
MIDTHRRHLSRILALKDLVKNIVEIWECDFDRLVKDNEILNRIVKTNKSFKPPLNPRHALSGGRTNAIVLHYEGKAGYIDFTSLYPYIQKYGIFPLGHPQIITENFKEINSYFGLVYCTILPPRNLYIPTLPYHVNGKLLFPLCAVCATEQLKSCIHTDAERELEGTWVTLEVDEAIKHGYRISQLYEVWHWDQKEQYDPKLKKGGLFTDYVNTFLRIKQEASGYPHWVKTDADKNKYISDYFIHEGIQLDKSKIQSNSGLKTLSKLLLNSQWGRYAMQTNKTQSKFLSNARELYNFFENDQFEVKDLLFPTDNVSMIYYEDKNEMHMGSDQTNVVIAAFVTAQARLKLYKELIKLDKRVLYFDTDSIIYKKIEGEYEPLLGDYLGQFTNEIDPSEGEEIVEFVSAGPKNYSYKLNTGITHSKVKGFSLNFSASKKVDFTKMCTFVKNYTENENSETIQQSTIIRNKKDWTLSSKILNKIYRVVYDKRIILEDLTTVPYGFLY